MSSLAASAATHWSSGRHGRPDGAAGVRLRSIASRALITVMARRRASELLSAKVRQAFDLELPSKPVMARGPAVSFLWCGHQQWFAMADETAIDLRSVLKKQIGALASLSDQSDARFIIELSGPAARSTLAKLVPIDFHPRAFHPNETAVSLFGHISGQITQIDDAPTYELMVFRGFADSFLHDVLAAGAEYGVDLWSAS